MIKIDTDRLILRNVTEKDIPIIFDYRNNKICAKYQRGQTKDYEGIIALVEQRKDDVISTAAPFYIAVALKESDEMIGEIVVMPNDGTISLGYTFSYKHHRNGYAFESTIKIEFSFTEFTIVSNSLRNLKSSIFAACASA